MRGCSQQGIALIIVLWTVTMLAALTAVFSHEVRQGTRQVEYALQDASTRALLEGGLHYGIQQLLFEDSGWVADGRQYELSVNDTEITVSLQDERGKVDINAAPPELIRYMLAGNVASAQLPVIVDAIVDWRDKDSVPQALGAEDQDYQRAGFRYGARDGGFMVIDEIPQVFGFEYYHPVSLHELFTVYTGSAGVDPATVPIAVLAALPGMDESQAQEYARLRMVNADANNGLPLLPEGTKPYLQQSGLAVYTITAGMQKPEGVRIKKSAIVQLHKDKAVPYTVILWRDALLDYNISNGAGNG